MAKFLDQTGLAYFYGKLADKFALESEQLPAIANRTINTATGSMDLYSVNLNNVTTSGFYNAMTCTNAKYQYSTLLVIGYYLTGYCTQIQCDVTTGEIATRSQINGSWSTWKEISQSKMTVSHDGDGTVTIAGLDTMLDASQNSY